MKTLLFRGATAKEASENATKEIGKDFLVIKNTEIRKKTHDRDALYELIVGIDDATIDDMSYSPAKRVEKEPLRESYIQQREQAERESEAVYSDFSNASRQIAETERISKPMEILRPQESLEKIIVQQDAKEMKELRKQMSVMVDRMKLLQNMLWNEKSPELSVEIPSEFAEIYKIVVKSGMRQEHIDEIMKLTIKNMPSTMKNNSDTVKRYFRTILRQMIPIRGESRVTRENKNIIMIVGTTGVGKTTSIAKLSARYIYAMKKKHKVGIIVLDTYKIGAVEQLIKYASIMEISIETVSDPSKFSSALKALSYCDCIFIDTAGAGPSDKKKIAEINENLLQNNSGYKVEVILAITASIKYEDMKASYYGFESLGVDTIMFTKLDETMIYGDMFSFVREINKPISYFCVGQEVPEDIEVASSNYLVDCLIDGVKKGV